jgi:hypothetical protein
MFLFTHTSFLHLSLLSDFVLLFDQFYGLGCHGLLEMGLQVIQQSITGGILIVLLFRR